VLEQHAVQADCAAPCRTKVSMCRRERSRVADVSARQNQQVALGRGTDVRQRYHVLILAAGRAEVREDDGRLSVGWWDGQSQGAPHILAQVHSMCTHRTT
jgi:hypothetical protein